jgi:hypothetical protein
MPAIRAGLDNETYDALLADAERHLRPAERHIAALLRQALGLPVPLPPREAVVTCEGNHRLIDTGKVAEVKEGTHRDSCGRVIY